MTSPPVPHRPQRPAANGGGDILSGNISVDDLVDGDWTRYQHLDRRIEEIVESVQKELVETGAGPRMEAARTDPALRHQLETEIDRMALARIIGSGRGATREEQPYVIASVANEIIGLGPLEPLWQDPSITEVMVNGPEVAYVERNGLIKRATGVRFRSQKHLLDICQKIVAPINRKLDVKSPLVDGRLADGSRVNVVHQAIAPAGPLLTIRRFPEVNRSLADLVDLGAMSPDMAQLLVWLVRNRSTTLVVGGTGSGKLLELSTKIPTPSGWTTMGELKVGDTIIGRDGRPCHVTFLSDIEEEPTLYRLTFSDGQEIIADANHQWVVSNFDDRRRPRRDGKRDSSIARYESRETLAAQLATIAADLGDQWVTKEHLWDRIRHLDLPWNGPDMLWYALAETGCPAEIRDTETRSLRKSSVTMQKVKHFPAHDMLDALTSHWAASRVVQRNQTVASARVKAATLLREGTPEDATLSIQGCINAFQGTGLPVGPLNYATIRQQLIAAGLHHIRIVEEKKVREADPNFLFVSQTTFYPARTAIEHLTERLFSRYNDKPTTATDERILTTQMMVDAGIRRTQGHAEFAVKLAAPVDLPEVSLPVDPYVLGAWLGDGSIRSGGFTGIDSEIIDQIEKAGFRVSHNPNDHKSHYILGLTKPLREVGVFNDKRIPLAYLRASYEQRLALLQGLMDTDGSITPTGSCEISQNKADLADDILHLIRSLGIKASISRNESAYMATDKTTGERYRKVTGIRNRIKFTTTRQVFRLPRKLERLPDTLRETNQWLYITDIAPVETEPGRCIQVDSPDSTYLIEDFLPTHNTTLLNALSAAIPREERVITIEDSLELRLSPHAHVAAMEGRPPDASGDNAVSIRALVKNALRQRPDRIIVGEVRDESALEMLQACNTGHEGSMSTVHANGPNEAVARLSVMVAQGGEFPSDKVDWLVGSALDMIVMIRRYKDGSRRVSGLYEVPELEALSGAHLRTVPLWEWVRTGTDVNGRVVGEYVQRSDISEELRTKLSLDFEPYPTWEEVLNLAAR